MAVHRAIGGRDPLSYPKLENDDNFVGKKEMQVIFLNQFLPVHINFKLIRNFHSPQVPEKPKVNNHGADFSIQEPFRVFVIKFLALIQKPLTTVLIS